MSVKRFIDLQIGEKFRIGTVEYEKTPDERISCCKVNNAKQVTDPNTKIQVTPITEVEVND